MNQKSTFVGKVLSIFVSMYVALSLIFVAIGNFNFLKKHGFQEWIFFGEIEPTVAGFFWPVFGMDSIRELQSQLLEDSRNNSFTDQLSEKRDSRSQDAFDFVSSARFQTNVSRTFRISQMDYDFTKSMLARDQNNHFDRRSPVFSNPPSVLPSYGASSVQYPSSQLMGIGSKNDRGDLLSLESGTGRDVENSLLFPPVMDFNWVETRVFEYTSLPDNLVNAVSLNPETEQTYDYFLDSPILASISSNMDNYPVVSENLKSFIRRLEHRKSQEIVVAKLRRVFDGCFFWVDIDEYPAVVGEYIGVRLARVDVPMLTDYKPEERVKAIQAKDYIIRRLSEGKRIVLKNVRPGQFYNIVADVYVDGNNLANDLIGKGLGKPVDDSKSFLATKTHEPNLSHAKLRKKAKGK